MKIVFFGSSAFAACCLQGLAASGHCLKAVVTQKDKPQARGMHLAATPVKTAAAQLAIPVLQPEDVNSPDSADRLADCGADAFVVIAYGQKLSAQLLGLPRIMAVNVHASLLPALRGAAPVQWALIRQLEETGVTLMKMAPRMDAGAVILQKPRRIEEADDAISLENKLCADGLEILLEGMRLLERGDFTLREQDESLASRAPRLKKSDGRIDWQASGRQIIALLRGCARWPGAFTAYRGKLLKIHRGRALALPAGAEDSRPGQILLADKHRLLVRCLDGCVSLLEVQPEAGRRMSAQEFVAGHAVSPGETLG